MSNQEISNIMFQRRQNINERARRMSNNRRQQRLSQRNNETPRNYINVDEQGELNSQRFLNSIEDRIPRDFDEYDYLAIGAPSDRVNVNINIYGANGKMNEIIGDEAMSNEDRQVLKRKGLELETLIVESLARNRHSEAQQYFKTLSLMNERSECFNNRLLGM